MSSACPEYEMRFTRRDNMKRHFNSRHENMKCIPPPPKETCYDYTPPPLRRKQVTTIPLLLLRRRKQATTILLLLLRRKLATTILLLHCVVQSCHHYNTRPKERNRTLFTRRVTHSCLKYPAEDFSIISSHGSIHLPVWSRTNRKWKIRLCQEIRTQYLTYDDPNTGSHHVVLWRIPDVIRNRRWGRLSTSLTDLDNLDPREKHLIILDDLMDETDQRVASLFTKKSHHRNISVMYIVQNLFHRGKHHNTITLNAHYMVVFKTRETYRRSWPWRIKCITKGRNTFWKPTLHSPTAI